MADNRIENYVKQYLSIWEEHLSEIADDPHCKELSYEQHIQYHESQSSIDSDLYQHVQTVFDWAKEKVMQPTEVESVNKYLGTTAEFFNLQPCYIRIAIMAAAKDLATIMKLEGLTGSIISKLHDIVTAAPGTQTKILSTDDFDVVVVVGSPEDYPPKPVGICDNCGKPNKDHCKVHLIPCCPGKCAGTTVH